MADCLWARVAGAGRCPGQPYTKAKCHHFGRKSATSPLMWAISDEFPTGTRELNTESAAVLVGIWLDQYAHVLTYLAIVWLVGRLD